MKISELKEPYRSMALANQKLQGNEPNEKCRITQPVNNKGFTWIDTKEGKEFWSDVWLKKYPELTSAIKANYPDLFPITPTPVQIKDSRSAAISWWNSLTHTQRLNFADKYFEFRTLESLTGREIESVWFENKEVLVEGKEPCKHEGLTDTGIGYLHCPQCNKSWYYDEWKNKGKEVKEVRVTRVEVINYSERGEKGRVFVDYEVIDMELSYQDDGRTLKIFINN